MENNYYIKIDCLKFESCFFVKNNNKTLNYKQYNNIMKEYKKNKDTYLENFVKKFQH
jgi:hypothetical protein